MNVYMKNLMRVALVVSLVPALYAETTETDVEREYLSDGQEKVIDKITADFSDFSGDETENLVASLRTGDSLSYVVEVEKPVLDEEGNPVLVEVVNEDGTVTMVEKTELVDETIVVENTAGPLGFGGVVLALGLAEATLPEGAAFEDIVKALYNSETGEGILDMRESGMGWGQIYHFYDLKVGDIMSAKKSARPEKIARIQKSGKPEKAGKPDRPEKPEKTQKPERPEKPEKPHKPERVGRS